MVPAAAQMSFEPMTSATQTFVSMISATQSFGPATSATQSSIAQTSGPIISAAQSFGPMTSVAESVGSMASAGLSDSACGENSLKSGRNWAARRRPFLQQKSAQTARCASVKASEKIAELSDIKLELAKLQIEAEKAKRNQAAEEHKIRAEQLKEEHSWKLQEHQLKMEILKSQLHSYLPSEL